MLRGQDVLRAAQAGVKPPHSKALDLAAKAHGTPLQATNRLSDEMTLAGFLALVKGFVEAPLVGYIESDRM